MVAFGGSGSRLMAWSHTQKKSGYHGSFSSGQLVNMPLYSRHKIIPLGDEDFFLDPLTVADGEHV